MDMTLYEFNKMGYASLPDMDETALDKASIYIKEFLEQKTPFSKYWLLLNNENKYYTIFHRNSSDFSFNDLTSEIMDITQDLGGIKNIELDDSGSALEFWINYNGECCLFLLFDYTRGVIEV